MDFIWHLITNAFMAFILTIPFFLSVNLVLVLAGLGRPGHIEFVAKVRDSLRIYRQDMVLRCEGTKVYSVRYDRLRDRETVHEEYTGSLISLLTWSGGPRPVGEVLSLNPPVI